jgi:hypothetical protein
MRRWLRERVSARVTSRLPGSVRPLGLAETPSETGAVLWTTLGLVFGVVAERHLAGPGQNVGWVRPAK